MRTAQCMLALALATAAWAQCPTAPFEVDEHTTLLAHYDTTSGAGYADGDLDGDGDVDLADLAALLAVYGTTRS